MNSISENIERAADVMQDIICHMDYIDIAEGFISGFLRGDWKGQIKKYGVPGIAREFISALTQYNSPEIRVSRVNTRGIDVERTLKKYGIGIYGRMVNSHEVFFAVKRRQYRWALYTLLRAGFKITSVVPKDVHHWAQKHNKPVPAWSDKNEKGI